MATTRTTNSFSATVPQLADSANIETAFNAYHDSIASTTSGAAVLSRANTFTNSNTFTGNLTLGNASANLIFNDGTNIEGQLLATAGVFYVQAGTTSADTSAELRITRRNSSTTNMSALKLYADNTTLFGSLNLVAGTTSIAPIKFTAGTNLTTPVAGVVEYDGKVFYTTPNTTNKRALSPSSYYYSWTGSNTTIITTSPNFGYPAVTLVANTAYEVEGLYMMQTNTSLSTTTTLFGFSGAGATTDYFEVSYGTSTSSMFNTAVAMNTAYSNSSATITIGASSASARYYLIRFKGIVRATTSTTFNAYVIGSAITSNTMYPGSYIKVTPIGSNSVTSIGTWA